MKMTEIQVEGIVRKYAVEVMNSSFSVVSRYWFEHEEARDRGYEKIAEFYGAGFTRKMRVG